MPDNNYKYIWRCAKCSAHFANIIKLEGSFKQEKKCPKCKALNILNLNNKEMIIVCRQYEEGETDVNNNYHHNDIN